MSYSVQNHGRAYQGHLIWEEGGSSLEVERFAVRSDGVAFQLKGFDPENQQYETDGLARSTTSGDYDYVASDVTVKYYPGTFSQNATIRLRVRATQKGRCQVEGTWEEYGEPKKFSGKLVPFQPTGSP